MDEQDKEEKPLCGGGIFCLKLEDEEHSTQFVHLVPVKFSFLSSFSIKN
jgi:hypothetical protein